MAELRFQRDDLHKVLRTLGKARGRPFRKGEDQVRPSSYVTVRARKGAVEARVEYLPVVDDFGRARGKAGQAPVPLLTPATKALSLVIHGARFRGLVAVLPKGAVLSLSRETVRGTTVTRVECGKDWFRFVDGRNDALERVIRS